MQKVQPGDTLYIDLSGGMRDTAMLLVAVARYLRDIRDVTAHVLYTELVEGKPLLVRDSDKLYDLFDLISATDEFFATGRTGRLSGYLRVSAVSSPQDGYPAEQHRENSRRICCSAMRPACWMTSRP